MSSWASAGEAADVAAERKLAAKAKTIAEARDAGLLAGGLSSDADQCGPWLFLWTKVTNYVMNRTTALSSVMVETGEGKPVGVYRRSRARRSAVPILTDANGN